MKSLYSDDSTWLHHVPVGFKLLSLAGLSVGLFATHQLTGLFTYGAGVLLVFASLGRSAWATRRLLWGLLWVSVLLMAFHAWMGQWAWGWISVIRLFSATLLGIAFTLTTRQTDLLIFFETFFAPLKHLGVQPQRLAMLLALMMRFTEHFFLVWRKLDDAHRLRTGKAGGFKILAPLTLQMLIAARRVADTLHVRLRQ